jgi:hypothetical protein
MYLGCICSWQFGNCSVAFILHQFDVSLFSTENLGTSYIVGGVEVEVESLSPKPHREVGQGEVGERERLSKEAPVGAHDGTVAERKTVGHENSAPGTLSQASDQAQPSIRREGTGMVTVRLVLELANRGPQRGRLEDATASGSHAGPWVAREGHIRGVARAVGSGGGLSRGGGEGGRDWDGEKGGSAAGPGGPTSKSVGEAEGLEASAMENADPTERERAESGGEAATGEEGRPVGGSGSRLSWVEGGQRAGGAGGGGASGGGAAGRSAGVRGWCCRRSRAPYILYSIYTIFVKLVYF